MVANQCSPDLSGERPNLLRKQHWLLERCEMTAASYSWAERLGGLDWYELGQRLTCVQRGASGGDMNNKLTAIDHGGSL